MKRLDRYVLREMVAPFIIGTVVVALLFIANELIAVFLRFPVDDAPPLAIAQLVLFRFPFWLSWTLPIGMAMAASLAASRLSRESEVTALRASGVSIRRIVLPIGMAGLVVAFGQFFIVESVLPPSMAKYRDVQDGLVQMGAVPEFSSNVILRLEGRTAEFGTVQRIAPGVVELTNILLLETPSPGQRIIFTADRGIYENGVWSLDGVIIHRVRGARLEMIETNQTVTIDEPIRIDDLFRFAPPEEESAAQLRQRIEEARRVGGQTRELEVSYATRFTQPAACFIFAITSAFVSLRLTRLGPFTGLLVSFLLVLLYFNMFVISTEIIGPRAWLSPELSAALPNLVCLAIMLFFSWRIE